MARVETQQVPAYSDGTFSELATLAETRLREAGDPGLAEVVCQEAGGVLCLRGTLPSHHLVSTALSLVASIPGLRGIDNRMKVVSSSRLQREVAERSETVSFF